MKSYDIQKFNIAVLIIFLLSYSIIQAQMRKVEIEEISNSSHLIIRGIVSNKSAEFEENGRDIITIIEFNVKETIKGNSLKTERVIIPGGVIDNIGMMVSHTPQFHLGEDVIVFITNDYKGRPTITEWIQGKYQIINNKVFYESNEILAENFILGLKNFIQKGEQGKIEVNYNTPDYPPSAPSISSISPNNGRLSDHMP